MADTQTFAWNVQNALLKKEQRGTVFNVGKPHPIFVHKGIPDQPIRISPAVIRKARKKTEYNDHCVKQMDLERLPELLDSPVALLKSLTSRDKFVVVLDARDEKGRPLVAAVTTKNGLNNIDSIYGRENFDAFIKRTNEAGAILSVNKKKATEGVWAYQHYQGETTADDYQVILSPQHADMSISQVEKNQNRENQPARDLHSAFEQNLNKQTKELGKSDKLVQGALKAYRQMKDEVMEAEEEQRIREEILFNRVPVSRFSTMGIQPARGLNRAKEHDMAEENMEGQTAAAAEAEVEEQREVSTDNAIETNQSAAAEESIDAAYNNYMREIGFSDLASETQQAKQSPEEQAFLNALHQRRVVSDALKAGTLACLPGDDGYADTEPAVNIANGMRYHGASQLYLKEVQQQNGFPTAEYMTGEAIQKSGIPIRQGQHGVTINFQTMNDETGKWEQKNTHLFNVAQVVRPNELKAYAAHLVEEKAQEKLEYLRKQYGEKYTPPERKERGPAPEITCSSTEPEKYLGEYLAAVSMGSKFKVTPEQKADFTQKMEAGLYERGENGKIKPFQLSKICNAASDHCKEVIKQTRAEQFPKHEQTQEQQRGRSR